MKSILLTSLLLLLLPGLSYSQVQPYEEDDILEYLDENINEILVRDKDLVGLPGDISSIGTPYQRYMIGLGQLNLNNPSDVLDTLVDMLRIELKSHLADGGHDPKKTVFEYRNYFKTVIQDETLPREAQTIVVTYRLAPVPKK